MLPAYQTLFVETREPGLAVLRLNRPEAANALNTLAASELKAAIAALVALPSLRAIILAGEGKHFCAGADLKERRGMDEAAWHSQHDALEGAMLALLNCPLPVIAAVHGGAFGGGLELALACDFIYASDSAKFGLTEATLGIMPGMGGTQQLARRIGAARAKELIFTGRHFIAADAYEWGLINRICSGDKLMEETLACAAIIASNAPLSIRHIKKSVREGMDLPLDKALEQELVYYRELLSTKDRHEGINAFNEKRKARFTGE